jgi:transposase
MPRGNHSLCRCLMGRWPCLCHPTPSPGRRLHTQVWALHRQGWTAPAIAQQVGLSLRTVQRDLRTATLAGRRRRRDCGESGLTPSKPYLLERWNAGCYNAMRLCRDLRQRGYAGGYGVVAASARRVRQAQGLPPGTAARADPCQ